MKTSSTGLGLIMYFEGFRDKAYLCPAKVWTVGYGTTVYPDGSKVKEGDTCTEKEATSYLTNDVKKFEKSVNSLVKSHITQNQFDALVSFTYNLGATNLKKSTLLKKINENPLEPSIRNEFMKWVNAGGKKLEGLVRRRKSEAELYFS